MQNGGGGSGGLRNFLSNSSLTARLPTNIVMNTEVRIDRIWCTTDVNAATTWAAGRCTVFNLANFAIEIQT